MRVQTAGETAGDTARRHTALRSLTICAGLPDTPFASAHFLSFVSSGTITCVRRRKSVDGNHSDIGDHDNPAA